MNNRNCASSNNADLFTILNKSHSDYHLKVLKTIHILTHKPSLCKQNVYWVWIWLLFNLLLSFLSTYIFSSLSLHSPWSFSFLIVVLDLTVIREDRNRLVDFIFF